jgi:hypothetical protein
MVAMDMKATSSDLIWSTWLPAGSNGTVMKNEASSGVALTGWATKGTEGNVKGKLGDIDDTLGEVDGPLGGVDGSSVEQAVRVIMAARIMQALVLSFIE